MILVGLILLAAAVVGAVELALANRGSIAVHMWNGTWHVEAAWLALAGAVLLLAAVIGLMMMRAGGGRARRLRRERAELAAENRMLAERARRVDDGEVLDSGDPYPVMGDGSTEPSGVHRR
jgi:uncharacterized integral membrane protein